MSRLITADDEQWIERFNAGEEWWSQEVTQFLRQHALDQAQQGFNQTILFSLPGRREIVGFLAVASTSLDRKRVEPTFAIQVPGQRIPAVVIPYFGVARHARRCGYGEEMHVQLLEAITRSWAGTRLLYLQCWEENKAGVTFWETLGYEVFQRSSVENPGGEKTPLVKMAYDRYALGSNV